MTTRQYYLAKAAELHAKASEENNPQLRSELESLTRAYLRLAEQAERNTHLDVGIEMIPKKDDPPSDTGG